MGDRKSAIVKVNGSVWDLSNNWNKDVGTFD